MYRLLLTLLIALTLQQCSTTPLTELNMDFHGTPIQLKFAELPSDLDLDRLKTELMNHLEMHRMLDPDLESSLISKLNQPDNRTSVSFEPVSYDFLLQIMKMQRETGERLDLRTGQLAALWDIYGRGRVPQTAEIDTALAQLQRTGFISASRGFLVYGPNASWDTRPYLDAFYMKVLHNYLMSAVQTVLIRVGDLYGVINPRENPHSYDIPVFGTPENPRTLKVSQGYVALNACRKMEAGTEQWCSVINARTGHPGRMMADVLTSGSDPVEVAGHAMTLHLLDDVQAAEQWQAEHDEVRGLIFTAEGQVRGDQVLLTQLH